MPSSPLLKPQPGAARALAALALLALLGAPGAASAQPDVDAASQPRLSAAMDAYERCQWAAAFEQLAGLADAGHTEAARIALLMQRFGPALYAARFSSSAQQHQHWLALATLAPQQLALRTAGAGVQAGALTGALAER